MVKDNIIPLIGKPITALLDRMIENFIHTGNVGSCTDDCRKILERALQRVIQTGYYQKEHKECKHGEASLHEQNNSHQCNRCNTKLQHQ